jgi:hypothetical protein
VELCSDDSDGGSARTCNGAGAAAVGNDRGGTCRRSALTQLTEIRLHRGHIGEGNAMHAGVNLQHAGRVIHAQLSATTGAHAAAVEPPPNGRLLVTSQAVTTS